MKKSFRLIGMMAMAGVLAFTTSCKKKEQSSAINVALPEVSVIDVDAERAYIDYADGNKMKWNEGDQIMVFNLSNDYTQSIAHPFTAVLGSDGQALSYFESDGGYVMPNSFTQGFYYFYPAQKVMKVPGTDSYFAEGNRVYFNVPNEQHYWKNGNTPSMDPTSLVMACKVHNLSDAATLQHIFGFANMRVKGTGDFAGKTVTSVTITSNTYHISGDISVKLPGVDPVQLQGLIDQCATATDQDAQTAYWAALNNYLNDPEVSYHSYNQGKTMTLNCITSETPNGVALVEGTNHFIFTLRPGSLIDGFNVRFNFSDNTYVDIDKFNASNYTYCTKPATLKNFNCNY